MEEVHEERYLDRNRMEQLQDELEALRKKHRRAAVLTIIAIFLSLVGIASAIAAGRSTFEGILANEFQLGRPGAGGWAWLHQRGNDGGIELAMGDVSAQTRMAAGIDGTGVAYLIVRGPSGQKRLEASVDVKAGPQISLFDPQGLIRASVFVQPDGAPMLALMDGERDVRLSAHLQSTGEPRIVLGDDAGLGRLYIDLSSNGAPIVCAMDSNGECRAQFGIGTDDEGYFTIWNKDGGEQVVIGDDRGEVQTILIRNKTNELVDLLSRETVPSE